MKECVYKVTLSYVQVIILANKGLKSKFSEFVSVYLIIQQEITRWRLHCRLWSVYRYNTVHIFLSPYQFVSVDLIIQ
jgi:hypothetical protein